MKKLKLLCVAAILLLSAGMNAQTYSGGSGTAADPFRISSKADMEALANAVNNGNNYSLGKHFLLTNDITEAVTTVIGYEFVLYRFQGTFDGGGHSINMNVNIFHTSGSGNVYAGVFGVTNRATIKNLKVTGSVSAASTPNLSPHAGGICGYASNTTIINCFNTASISATAHYNSSAFAGGICGGADNTTITSCSNAGSISASAAWNAISAYAGGICGYATNTTITSCSNTGIISAAAAYSQSYAGGICGSAHTTTIANSSNTGNISASAPNSFSYAGGICGYDNSLSTVVNIRNSIAVNATIVATGWNVNAGIAGRIIGQGGTVQNCHAFASMQVRGSTVSSQNENSQHGKDIISDYIGDFGNIFLNGDFSTCSGSATSIFLFNTNNIIRWQRSADNGQSWISIDCTSPMYTETNPVAGEYIYRALNGNATWSNSVRGSYYDAVPSAINTLPLTMENKRVDESVTFSLDLADNNYNYQWYKGSVAIDGATNNTYTISEIRMSDAGVYHCQVWNGCNRVSASNTMLIVDKAPQQITLAATMAKAVGDADFELPAVTNKNLTISYTSSNTSVATVTGNIVSIVGVGNTTITALQAGNNEYLAATPATMTLTVGKGQQVITFNALSEKTYGDVAFALSANVNSDRTITYESSNTNVATVSGNTITILNAGTTVITAFASGDENWEAAIPVQQTLTINKAALTATADNKSRLYGANNPEFSITYSGFKFSDNASSLSQTPTASSAATPTTAVGDYPIVLSGGVSQNYDFTLTNGTLTINRATVTVTAQAASSVYGDNPPAFTCLYSGFMNGETEAVLTTLPTLTCSATSASGAGTYTIIPSGAVAQNYSFTYQNGMLTIGKRPLNVTPNNATRIYGNANPTFTFSYNGFVNGDNAAVITTSPTGATTATTSSSVGDYTVTCSGGNAANYSFVYGTGILTITKRSIQATPNNVSKEYGDANPAFTLSYTGFVNGDTASSITTSPTATTAASLTSAVGAYQITCSGGDAMNYSFTYGTGTLSITKAPLTVTADNVTRNQGQPNPIFTLSYSGFKNGDNASVLDFLPVATCVANESSVAGNYQIVLSGGSDNNYNYTLVNGTLRVVATGANVYEIFLQAIPSNGGTVNGSGTFQEGTSRTVTATPYTGYTFINWLENGVLVSANASYTFTVTGNRTLVAVFTETQTDISDIPTPEDGVTVVPEELTARVVWTANPAATSYTLTIYAENGTDIICSLELDAAGRLTGISFGQRAQSTMQSTAQDVFGIRITNLSANTTYRYKMQTLGANSAVIDSKEGSFTTLGGGSNVVETGRAPSLPIGYYSVLGRELPSEPASGIYIILYDNGKAEKVLR